MWIMPTPSSPPRVLRRPRRGTVRQGGRGGPGPGGRRGAGLPGPGERLLVHKNNSDGKGNSYGAHENYLMARAVPFGDVVEHLTAFPGHAAGVHRGGQGGGGERAAGRSLPAEPAGGLLRGGGGLETTLKRPIVNTRDEPHADPEVYRRLHVIAGDANLSEKQILLKLGSTALVLAALEAGALGRPLLLEDPVGAMWRVSHDPGLRRTVRRVGGRSIARSRCSTSTSPGRGLCRGCRQRAGGTAVLALWEEVLPRWRGTRSPPRATWIGRRSCDCWRSTGTGTDSPGAIPSCASSTCNTTTSPGTEPAPPPGCRRAHGPPVQRRGRAGGRDGAAGADPGLLPGALPGPFRGGVVAANWDSLILDVGGMS